MPSLMDPWQTTVTPSAGGIPTPQAPQPGGGFLSSIGNGVNTALTNPLFQFGLGMAGAGGQGQGIGGGLLAGAQNAPNAWKTLQMAQQQKFMTDLNDQTSPLYKQMSKSFSPAQIAIMASNPDAALELSKAQAVNGAELQRLMTFAKWQQDRADAAGDELLHGNTAGPQLGGAQPGTGTPQNYPRPQSAADVQSLPPGTLWQAPDGSLRRR